MDVKNKEVLAASSDTRVIKLEIEAPDISRKALPGQFVVFMVSPQGERVPLTIVDTNPSKGTITVIFQELGYTTKLLGRIASGDRLFAIVGPLGHATDIRKIGRVVLVGGGVGVAEIFPVAKSFRAAGNHVTAILGARTKDLVILEREMREVCDDVRVTTDDGTAGRKGFTTDVLKEILSEGGGAALVYAVGPIPMMRKVADVTKPFGVKTVVSLNALMVDATGMCGCCRVTVGGQTKFSCVDGPEFDAHQVDWAELVKRNQVYSAQEKHICLLLPKAT